MDRIHKKHTDDGYDFTSKKIKQEGELEVTGVSRSGRVRKKSSKLTDFESLDEIDIRTNSRIKKEKFESTTPTVPRPIKKERIVKDELTDEEADLDDNNYQIKQEPYSDDSANDGYPPNEESSMDSVGSDLGEMDDEEDDLEREDETGFQPITGDESSDEGSQQRGLYRPDKRNIKKVINKDGRILGKIKNAKKDIKGIWKKRPTNKPSITKRPQTNINQTTRPNVLSQGGIVQEQSSVNSQIRKSKPSPTRRFGGKQSLQQSQQQHQQEQQKHQQFQQQQVLSTPIQTVTTASTPNVVSTDSKIQSKSSISTEPSVFKPVSTSALDVAAHLKLLGESLTIIGERLTEHEGQIAVSGSFSVLLDSLLCALGPLLCLTQQVPQMNVVPQEQLSKIMDNIAYIMPGL